MFEVKMPWFYYVTRLMVRTWFRFFTRWQVKGKENVPDQGPLLIVANHVNLVDVPLLGVSFDRRVIFMAKKELFHFKFIGYLIGGLGAFPVHREQLDRKALHQANQVLAGDQALVIFPEGTRSHNGQLRHAFSGSALIALRNYTPILPVGIIGTDKARGATWMLHRPKITINIGHLFRLPPINGKLSKTELTESTNCIMKHIAELLPVEYRGSYAEQEEPDGTNS